MSPVATDPVAPPLPFLKPLAESADGAGTDRLVWYGDVLRPGGYAACGRESILGLRRAGHPVEYVDLAHAPAAPGFLPSLPLEDLRELKAALAARQTDGVLVAHCQPALRDGRDLYRALRWSRPEQLAYVGYTTFETESLPAHWVEPAAAMDEIWVPSTFNVETFARAGLDPERIHAVGYGLDPVLYDPSRLTPLEIPERRAFAFLSVFQWHARKGWPVLVEAFARAFSAQDDVCLVLKTLPAIAGAPPPSAQVDALLRSRGISPGSTAPILTVEHPLSDEDMRRLYRTADAFVLPTRGEGWGIPFMEAMACGRPTIGTRYGGHLDFMTDDNSYLLETRGLVAADEDMLAFSPEYEGQRYADPDPDHLVHLLREVRGNAEAAGRRGARARRDIATRWTLDHYVDRLATRARDLQARARGRRRDPGAPPTRTDLPTVVYRGPLFEAHGYAHDLRAVTLGLLRAGADLRIEPRRWGDRDAPGEARDAGLLAAAVAAPPHPTADVVVEHTLPSRLEGAPDGAIHVARTVFETDRLPWDWGPILADLDEVWVPGAFSVEAFARAGVPRAKIHALPLGIDTSRYGPHVAPLDLPGDPAYRFLACFDLSLRKGWDVLVRAVFEEFSPDDGIELVLNVHSGLGLSAETLQECILAEARRHARLEWEGRELPIRFLEGDLDPDLMPGLYRAADAYVMPSRGEGWGIPAMEAMASGRPVIATGWGGQTEYMTSRTALLVDWDLVPVSPEACRESPTFIGQMWAEPRLEDLRAKLRWCVTNPTMAGRRGECGRERIGLHFGLEAVGARAVTLLEGLDERAKEAVAQETGAVAVAWRGPVDGPGSLTHVSREIVGRLTTTSRVRMVRDPAEAEVVVSHGWPPRFDRPAGARRHAVILPWEYGRIPEGWVREIDHGVDEVWVPTHHVFRGLVASGVPADHVRVIPNGVDSALFRPDGPVLTLPTEKQFRFLYVGGTIWRKGVDLLVAAYDGTFHRSHDVTLVIKDFGEHGVYRKCSGAEQLRARVRRQDRPEIVYVDQHLSPEEMAALYRSCHVLVHPYRGEGFALPVAEAGASGLPAIVTKGGATDDFVSEASAYLVRSEEIPFRTEEPFGADGWVRDPDVQHLAERMRECCGDPEGRVQRGQAASARMTSDLGWDRIVEAITYRLLALAEKS